MNEISNFIKRVAERTKFKREYFIENNIPNVASNIIAIPFYGNLSSTILLSSFILKRYKELHPDKYIIMCSWHGYRGLFPYVDEYWSIDDEHASNSLALGAKSFYNTSGISTEITRNIMEAFNIISGNDIKEFYNEGFTKKYWDEFEELKRFLPEIPSETLISKGFKQQIESKEGKKVIIHPTRKISAWQQGKSIEMSIGQDFWEALCNRLLEEGYVPVIWQDCFTYDLSKHFVEKCIYLVSKNVIDVLAAMRYIGFVIDIHGDTSMMATSARTPFISVEDRQVFVNSKKYIFDKIGSDDLPKKYIFSFPAMLTTNDVKNWNVYIFDNIIRKLNSFGSDLIGRDLGSTSESYDLINYENIKQIKSKRMGVHFIRSSRNEN